jgi:phosphopantetheine--protein transferase-like protein
LCKWFNVRPDAIGMMHNSFGKPKLTGTPGEMHFNLSHSKGISALVFDQDHEVGVDIERIDRHFDYQPIVSRYFTEKENRFINDPDGDSIDRFYRVWTRKEALLKALGTGITRHLDVEVTEGVYNEDGSLDLLLNTNTVHEQFVITIAYYKVNKNDKEPGYHYRQSAALGY